MQLLALTYAESSNKQEARGIAQNIPIRLQAGINLFKFPWREHRR